MPPFNPTILIACQTVPEKLEEYVDPHITSEMESYDVEINPNHPTIAAMGNDHRKIEEFLVNKGFLGAKIYYTGPGRGEPPDLSGLMPLEGYSAEIPEGIRMWETETGGVAVHFDFDMELPTPFDNKKSKPDYKTTKKGKRKKAKGFG